MMKSIAQALAICILGIHSYKAISQSNTCTFNDKSAIHVTPLIKNIDYKLVRPSELLNSRGIMILCHYTNDSGNISQMAPQISGFDYCFLRRGNIYRSGVSNSTFFEKELPEIISDVLPGDSLLIYNIKVYKINGIDRSLDSIKNTVIDSIALRFGDKLDKIPEEELKVNRILFHNKLLDKLVDYYASDLCPDCNFTFQDFKYDKNKQLYTIRYIFGLGENTNYDFSFEIDKSDVISGVIDNNSKKHMTLHQWESSIGKDAIFKND